MEQEDERSCERLHRNAAASDNEGSASDSGLSADPAALSSADRWAEPQDPEAELPYISDENWRILVVDILPYIAYQHKRSHMEQGISNRSSSASMRHLVRNLRGTGTKVLKQPYWSNCLTTVNLDFVPKCGQQKACWGNLRSSQQPSCCRPAPRAQLGNRQDRKG